MELKLLGPVFNDLYDRLSTDDGMLKLMEKCPSLARDPFAHFFLKDFKMVVSSVTAATSFQNILRDHPCLRPAINAIKEAFPDFYQKAKRRGAKPTRSRTQRFALDINSDDSESENEATGSQEQASRPPIRTITSNALRNAFDAVLGAQLSGTEPHSAPPASVTDSVDMDIDEPTLSAPQESEAGSISARMRDLEQRYATQLAQLAEMGVFDVPTAIQALEATNGDLELAFQIIFN
ncbi:Ubiquitin-like protein 7 [Cichlidogyrus casuarinus]|uniref:Ubiquitin-like protein 7 n=1 Tax=Cichlidogyrus casuarinus TaxID=1844966 RepID=A0ABD2QKR1_9PLAT